MIQTGIRRLREARDLSQEDLAEVLGTSRDYIGKLERGNKRLNLEWIERIALALNVEPYELLIDRPDEEPRLHSFQSETIAKFLGVAVPALLESRAREGMIQKAAREISAALEVLALDPDREQRPDVVDSLVDQVALALGVRAPSKDRLKPDTPDHTPRSA